MSEEQFEITLREEAHDGGDDLIQRLKRDVDSLYQCGLSSGKNYIKGKSDQEVAKAAEIKSKVMANLGAIETERQKLIQEREKNKDIHNEKMYELQTKRLQAVVDSLVRLEKLGGPAALMLAEKLVESLATTPNLPTIDE